MKFVFVFLFLGLSIMACAQTQTPDQPNAPSATQLQANAQGQAQQPAPQPAPPTQPNTSAQVSHSVKKATTSFHRVEVGGGYAHVTGDEGLNGFTVTGAIFLDPKISIAFNYDGVYNTSVLGAFALTNVGLTTSKDHLQNFIIGPRIYTPGITIKGCGGTINHHIANPFIEAQFGESNLYSQVTTVQIGTITSADTAFTWELGGGADFPFRNNWAARVNVDLLRTHFVDEGQSRLRLVLGVVYRFF